MTKMRDMSGSVLSALGACAALLLLTACGVTKSANPLSPTVAGPIPGVNITAPKPLDPSVGAQIAADKQPLTLMVQNASTSGVRPLSYVFEVATDASFTNKVFSRDSITPGDGGHTTLKLPDALATGKTYYWHARAQDGANTGDFSTAASFNVFTPIIINAPVPQTPAPNATLATLRPVFTVANAAHAGPVGALTYQFQLSATAAFTTTLASWTAAEGAYTTSLTSPLDLVPGFPYFWRVRAADPTTAGAFSAAQSFTLTPAVAPTPPTPTNPTPPQGGADILTNALVWDNPQDLGSWPVTTTITSVQFTSSAFLVDFDKRTGPSRWPDVPFGTGNLEYTLGLCVNIQGQWNCSATVQFWYGRDLTASGRPDEIALNWWYDRRWGNLMGYQPAMGETVGIFVAAGNLRDSGAVITKQRSNVVLMPFGGSYTASAAARMLFRR
jgi:hypothetical protein